MSEEQNQDSQVKMRKPRQPLSSNNAQNALLRGLEVLQEGEANEETEGWFYIIVYKYPLSNIF